MRDFNILEYNDGRDKNGSNSLVLVLFISLVTVLGDFGNDQDKVKPSYTLSFISQSY